MERSFNRMQEDYQEEIANIQPTNQNSTSLSKKSADGSFDAPQFSSIDEVSECHDGTCFLKRCVNGHCTEERLDQSTKRILAKHEFDMPEERQAAKADPVKKNETAAAKFKQESPINNTLSGNLNTNQPANATKPSFNANVN